MEYVYLILFLISMGFNFFLLWKYLWSEYNLKLLEKKLDKHGEDLQRHAKLLHKKGELLKGGRK